MDIPQNNPAIVNPKLRQVRMQPVVHRRQQGILLMDPLGISKTPLFVPSELAPLIPLIDGSRDLGTIRAGFMLRTGTPITFSILEEFISQLDASKLLYNDAFIQAFREATEEYRQAPYRPPVMAGQSCPADPDELATYLQRWLNNVQDIPPRAAEIKGIISPHIDFLRGGDIYGKVWGLASLALREVELIVILGTDHNGGDREITLTRQNYRTPWGIVPTDQEVVNRIAAVAEENAVFDGELNHRNEHSIEAALIWAHYLMRNKPCKVVPILCGAVESLAQKDNHSVQSASLSATIEVLQDTMRKRRTIVVAAADLAHVGPVFGDRTPLDIVARVKLESQDRRLMDILRTANAELFLKDVMADNNQRRICGLSPIYACLLLLSGLEGTPVGYAQCPASEDGGSIVSICGVVYHPQIRAQ